MNPAISDHLKEAERTLWRQYEYQVRHGQRKTHAPATLQKLIASLKTYSPEETKAWVMALFQSNIENEYFSRSDMDMPFPLFEEIVLPELIRGFNNGEPEYARWLGQILSHAINATIHKPLLRELFDVYKYNQIDLFEMSLAQNPDDRLARQFLITWLVSSLDFAIHEVPRGVIGDKEYLENTFARLQSLLISAERLEIYQSKFKLWRFHFDAWQDYLAHRDEYGNYADYLLKNSNGFNWSMRWGP